MSGLAGGLAVELDSLDGMLSALDGIGCEPRRTGSGWSLRCPHPGHEDDTPSATLRPGDSAPWLLHCHGCNPRPDDKPRWLAECVARVAAGTPLAPASPSGRRSGSGGGGGGFGVQVAVYDYVSAEGELVAQKVRYANGDRKSFGWRRPIGDAWVDGLHGKPMRELPMYGLHELDQPGTVYVVEGEKDAARLHQMGVPAVSSAGGARGELPDDITALSGRDVIVVADRDAPGIEYARTWAARLDGVAASVRLAQAAVATPGADVSDHLDAGLDLDALDLGPVSPMADTPDPEPVVEEDGGRRRVVLTPAATITPRRVRWLWEGRIAVGTLSLLAGREGLGKSTLTYWLVAQVTRGLLPGEDLGHPRAVLVCATEDSWAHVIVPRLMAAGADLHRVYCVEVATSLDSAAELSLPRDIDAVRDSAASVGASLLVLDPLMSRLSASLDTHRDAEVRQALEPLTKMLDRSGMAGLGLMHFNKSGGDDPMNSLMASRAFGAVARSVSTVVRDPDDDTGARRLLGTPKNNLGPTDIPMLAFTIAGHLVPTPEGACRTSAIVWAGEVQGTVEDALRRAGDPGDRTATQEASDWLSDYLSSQGGQAESAAVKAAGRAAGHSERAIARARERIGVRSSSSGFPRRTVWHLPEDAPPPVVPPVVPIPGETHITDMTGTTESSRASRASRASQDDLGTAGTTGLLESILAPCDVCGLPALTSPCTTCRRVVSTPATSTRKDAPA